MRRAIGITWKFFGCGFGSRASCAYERRNRPSAPDRVSIRLSPCWISAARGMSGTREIIRLSCARST